MDMDVKMEPLSFIILHYRLTRTRTLWDATVQSSPNLEICIKRHLQNTTKPTTTRTVQS